MALQGPFKIVSLQAENIKKLVAVEIAPSGAVVEITGRNGAGKTSVLDAIWWAIEGAKHIQAAPIRKGANKGRIKLDLGEIVVTRTFNRSKDDENAITTSIVVENADGARFPSPQKVLDDLFGVLTFDPMAFLREDPKKQLAMLRGLVPGVDFAAIDEANKGDFARRTEMNRNAKALRNQAAGYTVPAGLPDEPIDVDALEGRLAEAADHNSLIERRKAGREQAVREIEDARKLVQGYESEAAQLRKQADAMDAKAVEQENKASELEEKLSAAEPLPEPIDTDQVRTELAAARQINAGITHRENRVEIERRAQVYEDEAAALTEAMAKRAADVRAAIEAAKLPVPGLELGDEGVMLNGLPLDQASDAEQLRTAVAIAMAMNPKLRVIRVRDGSLLDDNGMALLSEMAEAKGYQVWVERVDSSGKVGFVIEDGAVKARPIAEAAE